MLLEKGKILFNSGEYGKCERLLRKSVQSENEQPALIELYAFTLQKLGKFEQAMGHWNLLILKDHVNADYYCERGVCKYNLGFRSALEDMDKAMELDPENAYRFSSRAYILDKFGLTEEAYHSYLKASILDPLDDTIQNNIGIIEYKLGYNEKSRKRFKEQEERLGISKMQTERQHQPIKPNADIQSSDNSNPTRWSEIKKMLSSWKEFRSFLNDAFGLMKNKNNRKEL